MTRSRVVSLMCFLVAAAMVSFFAAQAHRATAERDARTEALAAAQARMPLLLSYHAGSLDRDLDRALDQTTGSFTTDYAKVLTAVVKPTAARRRINTQASVSAAGVVSGDADQVVVLVFVTQTTRAAGGPPSVTGSRVNVTLRRSESGWKIAGLEPV